MSEDAPLGNAMVKAKILASATPDVLLFNQGNSTDFIEATANLLLRVQTVPTPKDKLNVEQKGETKKEAYRTEDPNVVKIQNYIADIQAGLW